MAITSRERHLHADVDRQPNRRCVLVEPVVELPLDPGEAVAVHVGVADDVPRDRAVRPGPPPFAAEGEAGRLEGKDLLRDIDRHVPRDPDEVALAVRQAFQEVPAVGPGQMRQNAGELPDQFGGLLHLARVGEERLDRPAGGEDDAVAVDDFGPRREPAFRHGVARARHVGLQHADVDKTPTDREEGEGEDHAGGEHPVAAHVQGRLRDTFKTHLTRTAAAARGQVVQKAAKRGRHR